MKNDNSGSSWIEKTQKILERQQRWQEQIKRILEPERILQQQLYKLLEPQLRWQQLIENLLEPQRVWQQQLYRLLASQRQFQEIIDKLLEPQRQWQQQLYQLLVPQWRWQKQILSLIEPERRWMELLEKYLSDLKSHDIEVDPSGAITLGNDSFASSDVTSELDFLSQELATASTFEEYLVRLSAYLERLGRSLARILLIILIPYIIAVFANLTTPLYQQWWMEYAGKTKEEITKSIREDALATYDIEQLKDHRFVTASVLRVRAKPNTKAQILDELPLGKVVKILEKEKGWLLVEYFDEHEDTFRTGWAFSRYLAKFTE